MRQFLVRAEKPDRLYIYRGGIRGGVVDLGEEPLGSPQVVLEGSAGRPIIAADRARREVEHIPKAELDPSVDPTFDDSPLVVLLGVMLVVIGVIFGC